MTDVAKPTDTEEIAKLLVHYGFDLDGYRPEQLIQRWSAQYPMAWLRLAVVEALYQGRYKVISVEQILMIWQRRQKPIPHFNGEFDRIVSSRLPKTLRESSTEAAAYPIFSPPNPTSLLARKSAQALHRQTSDSAASEFNRDWSRSPKSSSPHHDSSTEIMASPVHSKGLSADVADESLLSQAIAPDSQESWASSSDGHTQHDRSSQPSIQETASSLPETASPKPASAHSCPSEPAQWSVQYPLRTPSISQFIPTERASGFYSRLKSVVQRHEFATPPPTDNGNPVADEDADHAYDSHDTHACQSEPASVQADISQHLELSQD